MVVMTSSIVVSQVKSRAFMSGFLLGLQCAEARTAGSVEQ